MKRKIERSLRFGKPLEKFENMDKLLEKTLAQNPDITAIAVRDTRGTVLYQGRNRGTEKDATAVKVFRLADGAAVTTVLENNFYHALAGISDRTQARVGFIDLIFSRQIVYNKLRNMAIGNLNLLWVLVLLSSVLLILILALVIMRPIKSQVAEMLSILKSGENPAEDGAPDEPAVRRIHHHYLNVDMPDTMDETVIADHLRLNTVRNEIDRLGVSIEAFAKSAASSMDRLDLLRTRQESFASACESFCSASVLYEKTLSAMPEAVPKHEKAALERLLISIHHLGTLLDILVQVTDLRPAVENATDGVGTGISGRNSS